MKTIQHSLLLIALLGLAIPLSAHAQTLQIYPSPSPEETQEPSPALLMNRAIDAPYEFSMFMDALDDSTAALLASALFASPAPPDDEITVRLLASGNVKSVLTNDDAETASTNGSLGVLFSRKAPFFALSALVNVAASEDTLTDGFGSSLLTPGTGNLAGILDLQMPLPDRFLKNGPGRSSLHLYTSVSSNTWKHEDQAENIVVMGAGALLAYDIARAANNIEYGLRLEFGLTYRGLFGDIVSNGDFRDAALGTKVRHFPGIELGFAVKVANVNAGLTFYRFLDSTDSTIKGLSSGQLAGGISLSTAIPLLK